MNELYPVISGALSGLAAAGALKGPIESLTQIWTLTFGRFSDNAYQKYKIKQAANLEKYANEVKEEIEKIPEENIQEPKFSVVGPALEASKFYMEEDEIRGMFAKLIASSMDKTQSSNIHPSFVEMIKMLSPLDAKNLYYLYHSREETISQIQVNMESGGYQTFYNHIFLSNPDCQDNSLIEPSIDNLIRLKLVDVTYSEYKTEENSYEKHLSHHLFLSFKSQIEEKIKSTKSDIKILEDKTIQEVTDSNGKVLSNIERENLKRELQRLMFKDVELKKGIIQLTAFGRNFCKVCL
ncbi:DUF4393 domain-containing protein [Rodentibacter caecimuris]|uniref:DUF4393 domain-containing protein n=1 Tax=Rodentibacter caecimuris TaxID=1796644 RepID=UPI000985EAA5|nr:hypothetical protein BKG97_01970 [Rodentibacter heylii]